jgi:glutathione S-transferase
MSDLKVLGRTTSSNVMKVLWTLAELDQPFVREDVGGPFGGNDTPAFRALNPNGLVPTVIDGGVAIWESNTICRYLCNKVGDTALYPAAPAARSLCERWMDWQLGTLATHATPFFIMRVRTPKAQQDPSAIAANRAALAKVLTILESTLAVQPFVAGPHLTLADVALGAVAHRWFALQGDQGEFPQMAAWYARLKARPGYQTHVVKVPLV